MIWDFSTFRKVAFGQKAKQAKRQKKSPTNVFSTPPTFSGGVDYRDLAVGSTFLPPSSFSKNLSLVQTTDRNGPTRKPRAGAAEAC